MSHAPYGWIIDRDHLPDTSAPEGTNANAKGKMGPRNMSPTIMARLEAGEGRTFQMKDGDGEVYYTGRIVTPPDEEQSEMDFAPLDEFGTPNAGATEIWYRINGEWTEL